MSSDKKDKKNTSEKEKAHKKALKGLRERLNKNVVTK